jgi:HlyD family secretion protein
VRILTGTRATALMVPEVAITGFDGHRGTVWIGCGRAADARELTFGARDDRGRVEVTGGLPDAAPWSSPGCRCKARMRAGARASEAP